MDYVVYVGPIEEVAVRSNLEVGFTALEDVKYSG